MGGLNLHLYPSAHANVSRVLRIADSLASTDLFRETHIVGKWIAGSADFEVRPSGVHVRRLGRRGGGGRLGKIFQTILWYAVVFKAYRCESVAAVAAHNVWTLPLAWAIHAVSGAAFVYNAHELETETPTMRGLKRLVARAIERFFIYRLDIFSVVNESIADWYVKTYAIDRPIVSYNVPIVQNQAADIRNLFGISDDEMMYIHTGRLVPGRNIELIAQTFSAGAGGHVVFLGDGPLCELINTRYSESRWVHYLPPVAPESVVAYVRQADVALCIIDTSRLSYALSSPNKLFEGLAAGVPVLCSDLVEARRWLGEARQTWILQDPENQLSSALLHINKEAVDRFKANWPGIGDWANQVIPLVEAYRSAGV